MAERHHARVTDQDVGRHRQETPDQNLGQEAPPKFGQHERSKDQKRQDYAEPRPIDGSSAPAHFGVGTKSPVGRNSRVRISTTNETMTACAGMNHSDANTTSRLMKIAAAIYT